MLFDCQISILNPFFPFTGINYILKYIKIENIYFNFILMLLYFQIQSNADFVSIKDFLNKYLKNDLYYNCHGAHSREEQGHADEDLNSNNSL